MGEARKKEWAEGKRKPPMLNKKHTEEAKKKMSESHKGKRMPPFTEEHRRKMSEDFCQSCLSRFSGENPPSKIFIPFAS